MHAMNIVRQAIILHAIVLSMAPVCFGQTLQQHKIMTDTNGHLIPWYSQNNGEAYDHCFDLLWNWWINVPNIPENGQPHYMQHCTNPDRSLAPQLASDQLGMALTSWKLFYAYNGNTDVLNNAVYIANFVINHGLSPPDCFWPNLMYPCNIVAHPTSLDVFYDGDMYLGPGIVIPHVSANLANELVDLYKMTGSSKFLNTAIKAANTLAAKINPNADGNYSPWPFRVSALTDAVAQDFTGVYSYTTHFAPMLELFTKLIDMNQGNASAYSSARKTCIHWLKAYPASTMHWGNYFEDDDAGIYNNTETNADGLAKWILQNPSLWGGSWLTDADVMLSWTENTLGIPRWNGMDWVSYGTTPIGEETRELPGYAGQSHTSRHYSTRLLYCEKTGDWSWKEQSVHGLAWATYTVGDDGTNYFPGSGNWYTDGYGDYFQHFLLAMGACPDLANDARDHLLRSSSIIQSITYDSASIYYSTYDTSSTEVLRITFTPLSVIAGKTLLPKCNSIFDLNAREGYTFEATGDASGVLRIRHDYSGSISVSNSVTLTAMPAYDMSAARAPQLHAETAGKWLRVLASGVRASVLNVKLYNMQGAVVTSRMIDVGADGRAKAVLVLPGLSRGLYVVHTDFATTTVILVK
jgi:hypothetical protein